MALDPFEAVIIALNDAGGKILGRTTIQKILYFGTIKNIVKAQYRPHYYGPYSSDVADAIQQVTSFHFVEEKMDTSETAGLKASFEWKRYSYSINSEGKEVSKSLEKKYLTESKVMKDLVNTCKEVANLDANILSWAAKVHYIVQQEGRQMKYSEIIATAESLQWKLNQTQIDKAVELLKELSLTRK